ncbi:MAG: HD domain-containing protein [Lachnospiraceae bacterium]|nr:HD domain-containing protein [Lachnospiraceae bacterium]
MIQIYYGSVFFIALLFSAIYIYMWHKHFDVNITMVFVLVPISCLGYLLQSMSDDIGEATVSLKIIYLGGCFLQMFILFGILNLCRIEISKWIRILMFLTCCIMYGSVLTIGHLDLFYKKYSMEIVNNAPLFSKEYGAMHNFFYVMIIVFFVLGLVAIVYSWIWMRQVPRTIIYLLAVPDLICVVGYFGGRRVYNGQIDLVPLAYVLAEFIYLLIVYRLNLYNISDTVIDSMVRERSIGYISFDFQCRYLGSNEVARTLIPELSNMAVDDVMGYKPSERKVRHFLDGFQKNPENNLFAYTVHDPEGDQEKDRIYNVNVNYLYDGVRRRGYLVTFTDDTQNRKYISLLDGYNEKLKHEVEAKTQHIVEMHDNLIMSLATMVESRDNSTGGHIKRTSQGVKILIDEIKKEKILTLTPEFCRDVVKAAPMHDLGKIAVDDVVLRKPGKFTDEEYSIMKHHAEEGARVIHEILANTDDESFKLVAENVAHYHHERWDGSGYPEGLAGENIPIEARIMAIADVYDALVSKRVYKEAYDFAKADRIIMEGMGTQFDPGLKSVYENARPKLEEYYAKMG